MGSEEALIGFWPLVLALLLYPVVEEIVFRGAILEAAYRTFDKYVIPHRERLNQWLANGFSSILFVLFHLIHHDPVWAILTFFPALLFGYFRWRYQSLLVPIGLHCYYNAGYFLLT
jgi:CAAX protease family protein